ncbi:MAG: signal peptidase I [Muribaculaceae bacterium]|nr:signal peptidase I [Muribaculaceae bacterium]
MNSKNNINADGQANDGSRSERKSFKERLKETRTTRWIRFGVVAALYTGWVIWMQSPIWLLGLILLFDIYITGYIPFTWWKHSKSKTTRAVMSWVDAIVYALVLVYFVFNFVGQNYQIPSSSLEKTLLTGDYLWVNKVTYGPRVPMTPIHFPLVHNTLPVVNTKSYLDWPSAEYRRLKGLRNVESGDIVVFNFPAGDTVSTKLENSAEYYDLLVKHYGWKEVNTNKDMFGDIVYRPVDRRTNFVKRAVGLPGERIKIKGDTIYINGKKQAVPENAQFLYFALMNRPLDEEQCHELGIALADVQMIPSNRPEFQYTVDAMPGTDKNGSYLYQLPMTQQMIDRLRSERQLVSCLRWDGSAQEYYLFPSGIADAEQWTLADYGGVDGLLIPRKGMTIELTPRNWLIYQRCIRNYEGHPDAALKNGKVYIDGKPAETYTFAMDYYFMMGDNRHMSQDSRFWGFVPEDHVVGTPVFVLVSFDPERSIFNGGLRWNRILRDANPDK